MNNEELEKQNKNLKEDFKRHIDRINELTNRIDKVIEYIENELPYLEMVDYEYEDMNGDIKYVMKEWEGKELLDILKGSDKE